MAAVYRGFTVLPSAPVPSGSCPPDMWQCGSGDCIPLIERCDRIPDNCLDGSDETGCPLLGEFHE